MFSGWVTDLGFKGILILFCLQVLQVVVSVIQGGPVELIAGAAYGAWAGLLIIESGCAAATMIVFLMVRRFGLPLIKRFFGSNILDTWGFLRNEKKTTLVTFILFLIPGTPKDTLTYLVPLSSLSLVQFTLISVFARFPAIFLTTVMGDAAAQGDMVIFIFVFCLTAVIGILAMQFKERLIKKVVQK
jgi:uncharacterized membrane protein YdjX (TVP38/TMEM64 family)